MKASLGVLALLLGATLPCAAIEHHAGQAHGFAGSSGREPGNHPAAHRHHEPAQDSTGEHDHSGRQPCCHDSVLGLAARVFASPSRFSPSAPTTVASYASAALPAAPAAARVRLHRCAHPPAPPRVPIFLAVSSLLI